MSAYIRPKSLTEATAARAEHADYTILAGGTDLLVAANTKPAPVGVIDLFGLSELRGIERADNGSLRIGAATTYSDLLESEICRFSTPCLWAAAREVGALQIQARGTVGGNIATSSPVGDTLPIWLALGAEIELVNVEGSRRVPYDQFCTGYRKTAMAANELIEAIHVPALAKGTAQFWRKMGTRKAQSISKVMVAATATVSNGVISEIRIGLGAVADRPIRARKAEAFAKGRSPTDAAAGIGPVLAAEIVPISDVRSSADYRKNVAVNVVSRFLLSLARPESPPATSSAASASSEVSDSSSSE